MKRDDTSGEDRLVFGYEIGFNLVELYFFSDRLRGNRGLDNNEKIGANRTHACICSM